MSPSSSVHRQTNVCGVGEPDDPLSAAVTIDAAQPHLLSVVKEDGAPDVALVGPVDPELAVALDQAGVVTAGVSGVVEDLDLGGRVADQEHAGLPGERHGLGRAVLPAAVVVVAGAIRRMLAAEVDLRLVDVRADDRVVP